MLKFAALILAVALLPSSHAADKIVSQRLGVIGDYLVTSIGIGSPAQYFDLYLDTSDDKLVVLDAATSDPGLDYSYDYIKNLFVPEASNTLNLSTTICRRGYQSGSNVNNADGNYVADVITLAGQQFSEKLVRLCNLNRPRNYSSTSSDLLGWLMYLPIDGFFGIRPGGEDVLQKIGLTSRQLSIYVNKAFVEPDNAGVVTFGGKDTTNCGKFRTFPSDDYDTWRVWVTQINFNSKAVKGVFSARFDLSNKTLVVPKDIYTPILNYFGGSTTGIYCNNYKNAPAITINIYGQDYSFPTSSILRPQSSSSTYCQLNLASSSATDEDQIVLNRNLLDKYCLFLDFDEATIGLADVKTS